MSVNAAAAAGQDGEFSSKIAPSEPLTSSGHQPGKLVGNDAVPEFHAKTLPAGTAPADRTFAPNNGLEVAPGSKADSSEDGPPKASDTITGATSGDVHTGLGKPVQGQSSAEVRHDGQSHNKSTGASLEGTGASGVEQSSTGQRALNKDVELSSGTDAGGAAAQEREPETAEAVASGRS